MKQIDLTYIIDDDAIFIFVLRKVLAKNGNFNQVIDFNNGEDVINALMDIQTKRPDVIFLDINMPVIDGWEFLKKLETFPGKDRLKVYIMSSSIDAKDIEKSKSFSTVKDFISKPINNDKLNRLLESI